VLSVGNSQASSELVHFGLVGLNFVSLLRIKHAELSLALLSQPLHKLLPAGVALVGLGIGAELAPERFEFDSCLDVLLLSGEEESLHHGIVDFLEVAPEAVLVLNE
jgi:hypothetical protein